MEIIPAIDLLKGNCVRLTQGDYKKVTQFNPDPKAQALTWQSKGATRLHLVDLDAARTGEPINDLSIKSITSALQIPVQLGGGVRTIERAEELLNYGLDRVILGTVAIEKPKLVKQLARKHPGRIIVGIDSKEGKVATRGWINQSETRATDLAESLNGSGVEAIISTDISTDGTLEGPNLEALKEIASVSEIPIIASGGVGSIADLLALLPLEAYGVNGIIIGRALYDGAIDLQEAILTVKNSHMQDVPNKPEFFV